MDAEAISAIVVILGGAAAALILRAAWRRRGQNNAWHIAGAWGLIAAAIVGTAPVLGEARGPFVALTLLSVGAFAVVAAGVQIREARARTKRSAALEPSERPSRAWRGWLRVMLAGPIGGLAAMGTGIAWTVWVPGDPQTRIVIGGMLVPILWAGGMAWTLSDDRIVRAAAVLIGVAVVTFGASAARGFS